MAGTGYTARLQPDWQSRLCIDGVPLPMTNNGHDPASAPRAAATHTDEDLMLELAHGRHEALGSLYSRHSRLVFYLALQSLERPAAEELARGLPDHLAGRQRIRPGARQFSSMAPTAGALAHPQRAAPPPSSTSSAKE